jgi:hypothetical protein
MVGWLSGWVAGWAMFLLGICSGRTGHMGEQQNDELVDFLSSEV